MRRLVIIGFGEFAREVYWHAQNSVGYGSEFTIKGFVGGNMPIDAQMCARLPLPCTELIEEYTIEEDDVFTIALANGRAKEALAEIVTAKNGKFIDLIHKTALISPLAKIGTGLIASAFSLISCNTTIGDHVALNSYSSIGHDAAVGSYTSIMAHVDITGNTKVGTHTYWGSGSRALPGSKIGDGARVGAGSVVLKRVRPGKTVFGVPAVEID